MTALSSAVSWRCHDAHRKSKTVGADVVRQSASAFRLKQRVTKRSNLSWNLARGVHSRPCHRRTGVHHAGVATSANRENCHTTQRFSLTRKITRDRVSPARQSPPLLSQA